MKKKLISAVMITLAAALLFAFTGCGSEGGAGAGGGAPDTEAVTYDSICTNYETILTEAGQKAVQEYEEEAAAAANADEYINIATEKVMDVGYLMNNGIQEMADLAAENGDGEDIYKENALKLYDLFIEEATNIYTAYADDIPEMSAAEKQDFVDTMTKRAEEMISAS